MSPFASTVFNASSLSSWVISSIDLGPPPEGGLTAEPPAGVSGVVSAGVSSAPSLGRAFIITNVASETITVDHDWDVNPDSTSAITIGQYAYHWVFYNNYFHADVNGYEADNHDTGSAGIQFSNGGGAQLLIVDSNTFDGVDRGLALDYARGNTFNALTNTVAPWYFGLVTDNIYVTNFYPILDLPKVFPAVVTAEFIEDIGFIGSVFRGNTISNTRYTVFTDEFTGYESGALTIWDNNTISGFSVLQDSNYTRDNDTWIGNTTNGVSWSP